MAGIVRFIADLHLGHENMAIKRGFNNSLEHDQYLISQYNKVCDKRDVTYILGDITMETHKHYPLLDKLNGIKHIVLGNHDKKEDIKHLLKHVNSVSGMVKYKGIFLTHCPIHPMELEHRVSYNIHGHIHEHTVMRDGYYLYENELSNIDKRYKCVSCEQNDYTPQTLKQLEIIR